MNVPRETQFNRRKGARVVRRLRLPTLMFEAVEQSRKATHRFVVDCHNSAVRPGSFAGLNLESGRRRLVPRMNDDPRPWAPETVTGVELRARCRFESGDERAVTVRPVYAVGDLFWVAPYGVGATESEWTALVLGVDVARLQDLSDQDARREGYDPDIPETPRELFQRGWAKRARGLNHWRKNPWVWIVRLGFTRGNVRDLYPGEL